MIIFDGLELIMIGIGVFVLIVCGLFILGNWIVNKIKEKQKKS